MYLHYHDYLLDGRWVLTPGLDDDDRTALVGLSLNIMGWKVPKRDCHVVQFLVEPR